MRSGTVATILTGIIVLFLILLASSAGADPNLPSPYDTGALERDFAAQLQRDTRAVVEIEVRVVEPRGVLLASR